MKYEVVINNYTKGAKLKTTPIDKIVEMEVLGKNKTRVVYDLDYQKEVEFVEKVLTYKLRPVEENE